VEERGIAVSLRFWSKGAAKARRTSTLHWPEGSL
jgi:hypothetical protein